MIPSNMEAKHFPEAFLQVAIELLIHKGILNQDEVGDIDAVETALRNNRHLTAQVGFTRSYREDFVISAREAFQHDRYEVAITLIAIANEHVINHFLTSVIMRTTTEWEATSDRFLRVHNPRKLAKLLPLAGATLPEQLAEAVSDIAALRNKIVHVRDRSILDDPAGIGLPSIEEAVSAHSLEGLLKTHIELVRFLDAALDARYPARQAARSAAQLLLEKIQARNAAREEQD